MNAYRIGPPGRQLAVIDHVPAAPRDPPASVVLCNPFGQEAIRANRFYKILADRLERMGCHVLRFDYLCSGDSDGNVEDFSIGQAVADVALVLHAAERYAPRPWLFGLRLGGTIAVRAAANSGNVSGVVSMDPIVQGSRYVSAMKAAHVDAGYSLYGETWNTNAALQELLRRESETELLGFPVGPSLRREFDAIDPASLPAGTGAPLVVVNSENQDYSLWLSRLRAAGIAITEDSTHSGIDWMSEESMNTSVVPAAAVQLICSRLLGIHA
ncbi:MAG: alpha/beta fold hydrolase [Betaproteobacteria bacterium]|nr:alpha/beta fold hydrolase [Betaproteobacteria bacterium]